jgi:hypothetical protein
LKPGSPVRRGGMSNLLGTPVLPDKGPVDASLA